MCHSVNYHRNYNLHIKSFYYTNYLAKWWVLFVCVCLLMHLNLLSSLLRTLFWHQLLSHNSTYPTYTILLFTLYLLLIFIPLPLIQVSPPDMHLLHHLLGVFFFHFAQHIFLLRIQCFSSPPVCKLHWGKTKLCSIYHDFPQTQQNAHHLTETQYMSLWMNRWTKGWINGH